MPVTALPPSSTERWYYDYSANGVQHTLIMRVATPQEAIDAATAIHTFLTAIEGNLSEIATIALRVAVGGSNITNLRPTDGLSATYGSTPGTAINVPLQVTFTGKSQDGHKARVGIFGWLAQNDASWRILSGEDADVSAGVTALGDLTAAGFFVSISGAAVVWNEYANIGYNDHWVKERRRSGGTA